MAKLRSRNPDGRVQSRQALSIRPSQPSHSVQARICRARHNPASRFAPAIPEISHASAPDECSASEPRHAETCRAPFCPNDKDLMARPKAPPNETARALRKIADEYKLAQIPENRKRSSRLVRTQKSECYFRNQT